MENYKKYINSYLIIKLFLMISFFSITIYSQPNVSSISSAPGAFSRMGFSARGMSMGNAMSAVNSGMLSSYYNPALAAFNDNNNLNLGFTFLSLDRYINHLNFSKSFTFYKKDAEGNKTDTVQSKAGVSIGIINAGVGKIDGRDGSGIKTETYSTSENQFFLAFALKPSEKFSIGMGLKLYYYSLFEKMTSTSFAFDFGAVFELSNDITISAVITDFNAKYKWDSTPLYDQEGKSNLEDKFPLLKKIGVAYEFPDNYGIISAEFESSNMESNYIRIGAEANVFEFFKLRAGIDKWNLSNSDMIPKYALGFQLNYVIMSILFDMNYAFVSEPYSPQSIHTFSIGFKF